MSLGRINNWLQIGANMAILAGLVIVGLQIRQSNQLTAVQMLDAGFESSIARELTFMGDNANDSLYRVLMRPDAATREDYFVAERAYTIVTRQVVRAVAIKNRGVTGALPQEFVTADGHVFASAHGRRYLDRIIDRMGGSPNPNNQEAAQLLSRMRQRLDESPSHRIRFQEGVDEAAQLERSDQASQLKQQ